MDIEKMRGLLDELAAFMKEHDLAELEVNMNDTKVKLRQAGDRVESRGVPHAQMPAPPPARPAAPAGADASAEPEHEPGTVAVTSPMVGTFYRAAKPEGDSFVEVGDEVKEETVLCIIEAMKVMNEIKAEHAGRVVKILVENSEPVEYGQPLFLIAAGS